MSTSPSREYFQKKKQKKTFLWHLLGIFFAGNRALFLGDYFPVRKKHPRSGPYGTWGKIVQKIPCGFHPIFFLACEHTWARWWAAGGG